MVVVESVERRHDKLSALLTDLERSFQSAEPSAHEHGEQAMALHTGHAPAVQAALLGLRVAVQSVGAQLASLRACLDGAEEAAARVRALVADGIHAEGLSRGSSLGLATSACKDDSHAGGPARGGRYIEAGGAATRADSDSPVNRSSIGENGNDGIVAGPDASASAIVDVGGDGGGFVDGTVNVHASESLRRAVDSRLSHLRLDGARVGNAGAATIADEATRIGRAASRLKSLHMNDNDISDEGALAIAEALCNANALPALRTLYLAGNPIGAPAAKMLRDACERREIVLVGQEPASSRGGGAREKGTGRSGGRGNAGRSLAGAAVP